MKRIITLLIIIFFWAHVSAQDNATYEMEVTVVISDVENNHASQCDNRFDFHASLSDGSELLWSQELDGVGVTSSVFTKIFTLNEDQWLNSFYFYGTRNWRNAFSCNGTSGYGTTINPSYFSCLPLQTYNDIIPAWGSTVNVRVTPKTYNVFYFGTGSSNQTNSSTWYLPPTQRVTIKATEGYSSPIYNWQYQIGNGGWTTLPSSLYPGFGHTLTFSGNDITSNYVNSVVLGNQTVRIRSVGSSPCGVVSQVMQLVPVLGTPSILNAVATAQSCAGVNDGQITITLDRPLYTGETVSIVANGTVVMQNLTSANFVNNSYTLTNLTPGNRLLSVRSSFNGQPSFGTSNQWSVTVNNALLITYATLYYGTTGNAELNTSLWYLPQSTRVTLKTTQGYTSNQYNWQYQIGNGTWIPFSPTLYSNYTLSFSGNDISADYINAIVLANQTVRVRLVSACGIISNSLSLQPVLTTPNILTATPTAQSCGGINDGKIKVTLSRALYTGETLSILINNITVVSNLTKANFVTPYTLTGLAPGTYALTVQSTYNTRPSFGNSNTTQASVAAAPSFTFATTSSNIHCPGGQDGIINITAQGGKPPYVAFLDLSNGDTQTAFFSASTWSITDLPADTYVVRLVDSKVCSPRDGIGDVVSYEVTITEPTTPPVTVSLVNVTPSAPGQSNGAITVRAEGGSGIYSFLWIEINTGAIFTADPPLISGNGMTDRLSGIGAGDYQVVVRDSQYALVNPQTELNTTGCQGVLEQTVIEESARMAANLADTEAEAYIQQFYVTPNPASGRFAASVSLREAGNFTLTLLNSQGTIVSQQKYLAESTVTADFEVPAAHSRGVYLLRLMTEERSSAIRVLIE